MREVAFLRKNAEKWRSFEALLAGRKTHDPDELAELYTELTNDLAYAQSHYPKSKTVLYLNQLTVKVHDSIHKTKKEEYGRLITFWTTELPQLYASKQKELLYSFLVFAIAICIGALSQANDATFVRVIIGDAYVNMTMSNIENGDPLAVYKDSRQMDMFFMITINNIRVSFFAFVAGLMTSIGSAYILFQNGIMVGAFFQFFSGYNLLNKALLVVFIHGTLELSAIVIAGAAGFVLGNSFLFPGTLSRFRSFSKGAKDGVKMIIGLVPVFIMAGLLESFVTRYTEMPVWLSLAIIVLSASFIIYFYILLPWKYKLTSHGN
ncbi:MAG: stage II sporulation protein M [Balneola sp.]|nr:MAG: stage II sporulation protein M [Balneola sp.]